MSILSRYDVGVAGTAAAALGGLVGVALASDPTITRSDAPAIANAISLRHSDLPSLRQESLPVTRQERRLGAQATACAGEVPVSRAFAVARSAAFVSSDASLAVLSQTEILPSVALVVKNSAASERPRALSCALSESEAEVRLSLAKGDAIVTAHVARLPSSSFGTGGTSGARMSFLISERRGTTTVNVPAYFDFIGFAYGQAEISFEFQSTPTVPSTSLERRLASVLFARVRTSTG